MLIAFLSAIVIPTVSYILLSTSWAQDRIRTLAENELSGLLETRVEIGRIDYRPFNTLSITSVAVYDGEGRKALGIGRVAARFELWYFLKSRRLLFDYAVVDAPELVIWRATPEAPLNIAPILDRFKKKDKNKPSASFDLKIATIILRHGRITYDVASAPATPTRFNANHIHVDNFNLHAYLRHAANDDLDAMIESMSFTEQSGLVLSDLVVDLAVGPGGTNLRDFEIELPSSHFALRPISLDAKGFDEIDSVARADGITIATSQSATISTRDFMAFAPVLGKIDLSGHIDFDIFADGNSVDFRRFIVYTDDDMAVRFKGNATRSQAAVEHCKINAPGQAVAEIVRHFNPNVSTLFERLKTIEIKITADATETRANAIVDIATEQGTVRSDVHLTTADGYQTVEYGVSTDVTALDIGQILGKNLLGEITATVNAHGEASRQSLATDMNMYVASAVVNGSTFSDINLQAAISDRHGHVALKSENAGADFILDASFEMGQQKKSLQASMDINEFSPGAFNIKSWRPGFSASTKIEVDIQGISLNDVAGFVTVSDAMLSDDDSSLEINKIRIERVFNEDRSLLTVESDFLNGTIEGIMNLSALPSTFNNLASHIVPGLIEEKPLEEGCQNVFHVDFTLDRMVPICRYFKFPVEIIYPVDIMATVNSVDGDATFSIDAPYLKQGDKIIDSTVFGGALYTSDNHVSVYGTTHMPTKKGPMTLVLGISGSDNQFDTKIDWEIERAIPINGVIDFATTLRRTEGGTVGISTHFNPGQITFGDDVWNIHPSTIAWLDGTVVVDNFCLSAEPQSITINGRGSASNEDTIDIALRNITLISIFENLEIENAMIGGVANGDFRASQLLSKMPIVTTDNLHVDSISYNHCVVGTADVTARWNNEKQSVFLDADILNQEGLLSRIYGDIFVTKESLDLYFDANRVRVGFMQPFMAAFASEVGGYGSGTAHLFGTFHDIDMEGDIFADNVSLKIDFTNSTYWATDSVHISPGTINLNDIIIRDINGNTALVNGVLTHDYFHRPRFNFQITKAHNFLCYNTNEAMNPDWYGTIYGNGSAGIVGRPGLIEISANMSTAPGTSFTFVLSDRLEAEQYSFIVFNDVTELTAEEKLAADDTPLEVKEYIDHLNAVNSDSPSVYRMDFRVDVTPEAQMILVMDPVGGDRIRAYGSGDVRLTYNSAENDIRMYGTYTLDRGNYNFTLQDIIIKDFTIEPGSSIAFRGDPYAAVLDIEAAYQLNASLTDLDESFAMDKDLNRTNVPVQAILKVSGDIRQPDLDFDLRFPTLTSDIYRKVRSIISTDDMMNRQIIYLLALNRFYTPDYMESTTKGSELFSVASSTIASQLSNLLGKISDNWSIAPNLRSDRGDFSDVEVDVALSSRLLNNRLLLNGNLGYRDKSLNTNQFVGDFDVEYLLTRTGNWRLKGYSRYNDQNYYVRTAPTTQGVGIMFRRDFDTLFPRRKRTALPDSIPSVSSDSISPVSVDTVGIIL